MLLGSERVHRVVLAGKNHTKIVMALLAEKCCCAATRTSKRLLLGREKGHRLLLPFHSEGHRKEGWAINYAAKASF